MAKKTYRNIREVDYFKVTPTQIFYTINGSIYCDNEVVQVIEENNSVMDLDIISNDVQFVIFTNGNGYLLRNGIIFKRIPHSFKGGDSEVIIYDFNYETLKRKFYNYSISSGEKTEIEFHGGILHYINNALFEKKENILYYNKDILNSQWSFSLEGFPSLMHAHKCEWVAPEIEQIVGVHNNILWVLLGDRTLLGINIDTGKLNHKLNTDLSLRDNVNHIDSTNGVIKTLAGNYYFEFDLKKLEKKEYKISEEFSFWKSNFYEKDKCLYFCAFENNLKNPNSFGVFDTQKREIVWHEVAKEKEQYFFNPPQANEKQIGILDSNKILHIYNKNDIII